MSTAEHAGGTPQTPPADPGRTSGSAAALRFDWRENVVYLAFVAVFVVFAITLEDKGFLNSNNLLNIVRQTATISVMAVGMVFVLSTAEIDLSIGAVAGLSSVLAAKAIESGGLLFGVAVGIGIGILVGVLNGALTTRARIPSFLVTLGMLGMVTGASQWITNSAPIPVRDDAFTDIFGRAEFSEVPVLVFWTVAAIAIGHVLLRKTRFGRQALATGGNETAARYSGVNTRRIKFGALVLSGALAGLAGLIYAGRFASGRFEWGQGDELSVIAAVILGGTSLFGGKGTVVGALIGSLLIGLINNGLVLFGLDFSQQQIVRGALIVLAVALARR